MTLRELHQTLREALRSTPPYYPFTPLGDGVFATPLETVKTLLVLVFLLPIRLLLLFIISLIGLGLVKLSILGLDETHFSSTSAEPPSRWRRRVLNLVRWLARLELFCMGFYWIEEHRSASSVTSKADDATTSWALNGGDLDAMRKMETAPIIVSNHVAIFESLYFFTRFAPSFVAKSDVRKIFIFGSGVTASASIFVERSEESSRQQVSKEIERRIRDYPPGSWPPLMIYPEQTTTNGSVIIYFKLGAFSAGLPVQPVAVRYPYRHFHPGMVADIGLFKSFIFTCLQVYNRMQVYYLPVHYPLSIEREQPALFAERVRQAIAKELQVPVSLHDITDLHFQKAAYDLGQDNLGREMNLELRRYAELVQMLPARARDCELVARNFIAEFRRGTCDKATALYHPDEIGMALFGANYLNHEEKDAEASVPAISYRHALRNLFKACCLTTDDCILFRDFVLFRQFMRRWLQHREYVAEIYHFIENLIAARPGIIDAETGVIFWLDRQFGGACWRNSLDEMMESFRRNEQAACLVAAQLLC
jgi:lysophosphatidylcholine acyltransferase/lyso-PAF acetyltransferase